MVVKLKTKVGTIRKVKNNDKSKRIILRGERNIRYNDRILSKLKKRQQK